MPFTQTEYKNICKNTFSNDGIALFRDESLVEERSNIISNIRLLKESIKYHNTNENNRRQIIAIIFDTYCETSICNNSSNITTLARISLNFGAPCTSGKVHESIFFLKEFLHKTTPPRIPRVVLCVVKVIKSA